MKGDERKKMHGGWNQKEKRRCWRPESWRTGLKASYVDLNGEGHHERAQVKKSRRQSEVPGEEGEKTKSLKRNNLCGI